MWTYKNDYKKDEDYCLWELHEIRHKIREEYKSSEASIEHMGNLGGTLTKFLNEFPLEHLKAYGDPSPQLLEMTKGLGIKVYSFLQGLE